MRKFLSLVLFSSILISGCKSKLNPATNAEVITAKDVAGTYTGVLEGATVPDLKSADDESKRVIVDLDLFHQVLLEDRGGLNLRIQSSIIPKTHALVAGIGDVAINLEFVEFEGLENLPNGDPLKGLKVKQVVFVKHDGHWVFVLQLIRVGLKSENNANGLYVYQYVSYPPGTAQAMSENEAIQYVNVILRLASAAQRSSL